MCSYGEWLALTGQKTSPEAFRLWLIMHYLDSALQATIVARLRKEQVS